MLKIWYISQMRLQISHYRNDSLCDFISFFLETSDGFMDKVAYVIRFMALFSLFTGIIVLIGAISNSRFARLKENVLLRTLGAVRKQIVWLTLVEYTYLGFIAGFTGSLLSIMSAWALSVFFFAFGVPKSTFYFFPLNKKKKLQKEEMK